nr:MAG TPA: hypothetical protein [Caudoviricetes sp.]
MTTHKPSLMSCSMTSLIPSTGGSGITAAPFHPLR